MFHLTLTFGLEDEPVAALERMAGFVESLGLDRSDRPRDPSRAGPAGGALRSAGRGV